MITEERIKNAIAVILSRRYGVKFRAIVKARGCSEGDIIKMAKENDK